ncbi:MAG: YlmC/YmxH family sporulation protein [Bacilli bacterium]|nr:YlmC/YmxH family sporulation protein [Bacilli bacterium]
MRLSDLQNKNLVNTSDGKNIGNIVDVNIDYKSGNINSFIIESKTNMFKFLNKDRDMEVRWEEIEKIGEDVILVNIK